MVLTHNALGPWVVQIINTMIWGVEYQLSLLVNINARKRNITFHNRDCNFDLMLASLMLKRSAGIFCQDLYYLRQKLRNSIFILQNIPRKVVDNVLNNIFQ